MADIKNIDVFQTVTSVSFEVEPNTNIININKVTIEGTSGSFTNLSTTQTATNFTINSDTGTDAIVPLGNGTLAGATLNDYTTAEKNKLVDTYTKGEVDTKITGVYKIKGSVANYAALPSSGQVIGDVWNLLDTGGNYVWTGTVWDELGTTVDISGKANIDSPTFTGIPLAPTAPAGTNNTQIATTAFTTTAIPWTKTGDDIKNNNTGKVIIIGGAGGTFTEAFKTQRLSGATWVDGFKVFNGGNFEYQYGYGIYLSANVFGNNSGGVQMSTTSGNAFISNVRIKYLTDLSTSYDDRTLVDKGYVNNTFVPYTGATTDVNLGLNDITAAKLIKDGGFDYQFLKADGSVDNNTYLTSADLPSTLDLYATTTASDISGYTVLVRNIADTRYNTTAVDVSTGVITSVGQLVGSLVTDANIISGNPGIFDFKTIGNISRTNGTGQAEFFFRIYKRNLAGTETLIAESDYTLPVTNGGYVEFSATALWNDGIFLETDRVVLKYYANRLTSPVGSDPTYKFQFGGTSPVRSSAAIPTSVMPNIYLRDLADVENVDALNNEILYWNDSASLWEHSLAENLVPLATATQKGLVSTTTQTFAGDKTFTGGIISNTIFASSTIDVAISAVSQDSDAISGESTNGTGVFGSSTNGLGGYFNTVNGANIAEFRTNFVLKAKIDSGGIITGTGLNASGQTINTIASFDASKNVVSLPTATYPSLTELEYVKGVTSGIQTQLNAKAPLASPTFTGTVVLPSTTSIGTVSSTEIGYLDNVTSSIQTQLDNKIAKNVATTYTTNTITTVTAAEYAAIGTKDANTLYFIV